MPTYDAILPAGGRIDADFAAKVGTDVKALIKIGDQTILERTLSALDGTGRIGRTIVIGGDEVQIHADGKASHVVPEGSTGPENILKGLKFLLGQPDPPHKVFLITTDLPFMTAGIIARFIDACPKERDICIPLVSRDEWFALYPNSPATFATLGDGSWTSGGAFLMDVQALQRVMPRIEQVFNNRKSVFGMAKLLGPAFLFRYITKKLTVPDLEVKIQSMIGCSGAAVRNAPTELAYDIDALDDYEYACARFAKS